ncbi:MAG TPA: RDD family protein [Thermoanaerobaculia bacterium]|nr:RDD family protein [Thermoanaerobaculia bacterium]
MSVPPADSEGPHPGPLPRGEGAFADLPLHPEPPRDLGAAATSAAPSGAAASGTASISDRALGAAADAATAVLLVLVALLGAFAAVGRTPRFEGLGWAAAFALDVSFFATVVPLVLFGRTVGMSLAGTVVRDEGAGRLLTPSEAARRWAGTLLTFAGLGLPLLWTVRDPDAPTLADRLSGRTLVRDG